MMYKSINVMNESFHISRDNSIVSESRKIKAMDVLKDLRKIKQAVIAVGANETDSLKMKEIYRALSVIAEITDKYRHVGEN